MKKHLLVAAISLLGCGGKPASVAAPAPAPVAAPADVTSYYLGTSDVIGMDGTVYADDQPTIVERTVSPGRKLILETVWVPMMKRMMTTTLTQTADPQVFAATDEQASFSGTLTYEGDPWNPSGWTYAITMADGGQITGTARFSADEITTDKLYTDPSGTPRVRIVDAARRVTRDEFLARRKQVAGN